MRLTEKSIRELVCPAGMTSARSGPELPGFGLRVRIRRALVARPVRNRWRTVRSVRRAAPRDRRRRPRCRSEIMASVRLGRRSGPRASRAPEQAAHTLGGLVPAFLDRQRNA